MGLLAARLAALPKPTVGGGQIAALLCPGRSSAARRRVGQHHPGQVDRQHLLPILDRFVEHVGLTAARVWFRIRDLAGDIARVQDARRRDTQIDPPKRIDHRLSHRVTIGLPRDTPAQT